ncbi:hypothetical protein lerEdw1_021077 [Lerista edwardsae]|nr:hypothetical protein lerEdw1_021078 [Lerista edwardsae]KAJ6651326.1 hypothetical protein lerEdw1_021077 [Lerista edwardsae]
MLLLRVSASLQHKSCSTLWSSYQTRFQRKNPPRPSRQIAEFQLSDAAQETLRVPKKRACKYRRIMSSSSSSSSDASPTTPTVVCDDNLGGATLSPSPVLSSEAVPETIQPKHRPSQLKPRVILERLQSTVPRASSNLLVSPQMNPKPAHRTIRRNPCLCRNLMVYPLTSSLGHAILSGQHRMEQLFRNTLGNRRMVQKKLQDILGHLGGLERQQEHLLAALKPSSRCIKDLDVDVLYKKMDAILNHQQMLRTSVVQFMKALGVEEPKP